MDDPQLLATIHAQAEENVRLAAMYDEAHETEIAQQRTIDSLAAKIKELETALATGNSSYR